ncbi:MAG TPA: tRNA epoxyqueuosine(34) reductase QueG [Burkholderiaceae bacterium]|jgi:epoxyqueuosine reductase|nr:tRNA epoxyqueuosine(34) reductase QueG [Burkholderiaceae bacterium]
MEAVTGRPEHTDASDAPIDASGLLARIRIWANELGFAAVGVSDLDVTQPAQRLRSWLAREFHGQMNYMQRHEAVRADPTRLLPGARRALCARMDYRPRADGDDWIEREWRRLGEAQAAVVSVYARGRDYHKVVRARLHALAARIGEEVAGLGFRVCADTAPVFEVELARRAALGWRGKHTLLLTREAGSMFFLGEILTDLPLPLDQPAPEHCGSCTRCIDVCPTGAIVAPYELDARRCISYLTIEHPGPIPEALRPAIGNRVYGCDDCQLVCPWNKYAQRAQLPDFDVRNGLDSASLIELFGWSEEQFRQRHAGSSILRIGYARWLRNLAVALGNAPASPEAQAALRARADDPSELVREHVAWALRRQQGNTP